MGTVTLALDLRLITWLEKGGLAGSVAGLIGKAVEAPWEKEGL